MTAKRSLGSVSCPRSYDPLDLPAGLKKYTSQPPVKQRTRIERSRNVTSFTVSHNASRLSLIDLPVEILLSIADLIAQREISILTRTSRSLYERLIIYLYQREVKVDGLRICLWSIEKGYIAAVRNLLDAGFDPNIRETWSYRGATPLHWAALYGNGKPDIAALLIEWGADIESEDYRGYTPFQLAIEKGNEAMVQVLIQSGVNGGHTNFDKYDHGCTAFHVATYLGYPGIVQLLLDAGEDTEALDSRGLTPLHWAIEPSSRGWAHGKTISGLRRAVEVLLDYGANPGIKNERGLYLVDYARQIWDAELIKEAKQEALC